MEGTSETASFRRTYSFIRLTHSPLAPQLPVFKGLGPEKVLSTKMWAALFCKPIMEPLRLQGLFFSGSPKGSLLLSCLPKPMLAAFSRVRTAPRHICCLHFGLMTPRRKTGCVASLLHKAFRNHACCLAFAPRSHRNHL